MKPFIAILLILYISVTTASAQRPPAADKVLEEAFKTATAEKKNVFIIYHASWCGWCHKMDTAMNDKSVKAFFTDNYVIRHLTVFESKGKKDMENPGALELLQKYNGADQGIPYWMIFDAKGKLLADSKLRKTGGDSASGENTGCPANEKEVAYFIKVLKQTSILKDDQLRVIEKRFRENESH